MTLPTIETYNRPLADMTRDALQALIASGYVFRKGTRLFRLREYEGVTSFQPLNKTILRGILARCAHWVSTSRGKTVNVYPPASVVADILSLPEWPGIPPVEKGMLR